MLFLKKMSGVDAFLPGFLISFSFAHLESANKLKLKCEFEGRDALGEEQQGSSSFHNKNEEKGRRSLREISRSLEL